MLYLNFFYIKNKNGKCIQTYIRCCILDLNKEDHGLHFSFSSIFLTDFSPFDLHLQYVYMEKDSLKGLELNCVLVLLTLDICFKVMFLNF